MRRQSESYESALVSFQLFTQLFIFIFEGEAGNMITTPTLNTVMHDLLGQKGKCLQAKIEEFKEFPKANLIRPEEWGEFVPPPINDILLAESQTWLEKVTKAMQEIVDNSLARPIIACNYCGSKKLVPPGAMFHAGKGFDGFLCATCPNVPDGAKQP